MLKAPGKSSERTQWAGMCLGAGRWHWKSMTKKEIPVEYTPKSMKLNDGSREESLYVFEICLMKTTVYLPSNHQ